VFDVSTTVITSTDRSTTVSTTYVGQFPRTLYDRRPNNWVTVNAYVFNTVFDDGLQTEIAVNPEFGLTGATAQANKYGTEIGRLPNVLRSGVEMVGIHAGVYPFGGGLVDLSHRGITVHTGQGDQYATYPAGSVLEEALLHEATHAKLQSRSNTAGWLAAQAADPEYISTYARDSVDTQGIHTEDIAESFLPWLAVRYQRDRISQSTYNTITATIPHRLDYFDNQSFNMYPFVPVPEPTAVLAVAVVAAGAAWRLRRRRPAEPATAA
jgi:hypothetical protein